VSVDAADTPAAPVDATRARAAPASPAPRPELAAFDTAAAPGSAAAPTSAAADGLVVGGLQPFTTIDYPGALAAVVFVQGCPWRCGYCHNPHLQPRVRQAEAAGPGWAALQPWLARRVGLIDAVVFSGGEPTLDPALPAAMAEVRALGLKVGLHTAGIYPRRLARVLPLTDWVGLDVKAPPADDAAYDRVTAVRGSADALRRSLALLVSSGVAHECRSTIHPALHDEAALDAMADALADAGVVHWALQVCRPPPASTLPTVAPDWPDATRVVQLRSRCARLTVRRAD
jgi:pyruvate formate lyase activating enzyme